MVFPGHDIANHNDLLKFFIIEIVDIERAEQISLQASVSVFHAVLCMKHKRPKTIPSCSSSLSACGLWFQLKGLQVWFDVIPSPW